MGHAQERRRNHSTRNLKNLQIFVRELFSVDALSTSSVASGEVATLTHKACNEEKIG
jgi:hypothetical protein